MELKELSLEMNNWNLLSRMDVNYFVGSDK